MLPHRHEWRLLKRHAVGRFDKQEGQDSTVFCIGRLEACSEDQTARIVPIYPPGWLPVEVEL